MALGIHSKGPSLVKSWAWVQTPRFMVEAERDMIVCPAVCWIWERQMIRVIWWELLVLLPSSWEKNEDWTKDSSYIINRRGFMCERKKRGGHLSASLIQDWWDGLVLFSQCSISLLILYMSMSSVIVSFPLMPSSSIEKLILSKPCRPTGTAFLLVHLCLQIPPVFFYLHFNPHLQNKQTVTLSVILHVYRST